VRSDGTITQESTVEEPLPFTLCPTGWLIGEAKLGRARKFLKEYMSQRVTIGKSPIRAILNELPGGWSTAFAVLEYIAKRDSESEEAKLMAAWEEIHAVHGQKTTPEMIAEGAGMTSAHMVAVIVEAAINMGVVVSRLVQAVSLSDIAKRGIKEAKKPLGFKDRERILQQHGVYPAPPGSNVYVNATAAANAGAKVKQSLAATDGLDEFERDTLDATEFLRSVDQPEEETKALGSPANFVDATFSTAAPAYKHEEVP